MEGRHARFHRCTPPLHLVLAARLRSSFDASRGLSARPVP